MWIKKIIITACLVSLCMTVANASLTRERTYTIKSFDKGLNSQVSPYLIDPRECSVAVNVRFNERYGSIAKREKLLTLLDFGSTSINGLHRYYKADGTELTMVATSTLLRIDLSGTATTIKTGLTDGLRWQFITFDDTAIGTNGTDRPIKYDGHTQITANTDGSRTASELCAELGAPYAELNTGANLDASSWYQYMIVHFDGATRDYSTARSNSILTGATVRDITLTDIPIGVSGTTIRYLYRSEGQASQAAVEALANTAFKLVITINDNSTLTTNDAITDGALGAAWSATGTDVTPPTGKIITLHNNRVFISGNTTNLSEFYWSDEFNPDFFDILDVEKVRPNDGDKITFLANLQNILAVGKTNTIQKFYTTATDEDDWYVGNPLSYVGCPAIYSVANTPLGIAYLARDGLRIFNGNISTIISDAVTQQIRDISQVDYNDVAGIYNDNQFYLSYTSVASGSSINDTLLLYDFERDAFAVDTATINCFESFDGSDDLGVLYSGSSDTDGTVFAHSGGESVLKARTKSAIDAGTYADTRTTGTEIAPEIEIGWDSTIDGWLAALQVKDANITKIDNIETYLPTSTIDRPDGDGVWTSPIYRIDANALDKLYWNENLGSFGDIEFQIRLGATVGAVGAAGWETAVSDPTGSDISGITANVYIQVRANMSTTDTGFSPTLFVADGYLFKIAYTKVGSAYETTVLSAVETGWTDFGVEGYTKAIDRVRVYYVGTSGDLDVTMKNDEGDIDRTFTIDLSVTPSSNALDEYSGVGEDKIFTYYPPANDVGVDTMVGQMWEVSLSEDGVVPWRIDRIEITHHVEELR